MKHLFAPRPLAQTAEHVKARELPNKRLVRVVLSMARTFEVVDPWRAAVLHEAAERLLGESEGPTTTSSLGEGFDHVFAAAEYEAKFGTGRLDRPDRPGAGGVRHPW